MGNTSFKAVDKCPCKCYPSVTKKGEGEKNDYDYENVFARQIQALGRKGDVFIGISTSWNS